MIKAIGFDLGDTLIEYKDVPLNWQHLYVSALQEVAAACHFMPNDELLESGCSTLAKYNTRINYREHEVKADTIFSEILQSWDIPPHNLENAINAYFTYFQRKAIVYDDTIATLELLKSKNIPIGILTDVPYGMPKEFVRNDIRQFEKYIDALVTSVEVEYRKPHTKGYELLAKELGVKPGEMMYIGNEAKDILGANASGMTSVFINRKNSNADFRADYVVDDLRKILEIG
jgi:putative hydrolase of the HAD superfamily